MKTKLPFFLLCIILLTSCSNDNDTTNSLNIRLSNTTNVKFKNATFNDVNFGDIDSGKKTKYIKFDKSYSYGSVKITINDKDYGWQPYDFIGEEPLKNGNYTFEYNFDSTTESLTSKLVKD